MAKSKKATSNLDKAMAGASKKRTAKKIVKKIMKEKGANAPQSKKYSVGRDASREAKPQGWRFTAAGAKALNTRETTRPTKAQIEHYKGKKIKGHLYLYEEMRLDKSDGSRKEKFAKGGKANAGTVFSIAEKAGQILHPFGVYADVSDVGDCIVITPNGSKAKGIKPESLHGMQIIFDKPTGTYEVSEYQAGPKQDELWIYLETKFLPVALKNMLKGNAEYSKRTPIKKWDNDQSVKGAKEKGIHYKKGGKLDKKDAIQEAEAMGVDFDKDFHEQSKGNELSDLAKKYGYKKPASASGSTGRYFFYHLQKLKDKKYAKGGSVGKTFYVNYTNKGSEAVIGVEKVNAKDAGEAVAKAKQKYIDEYFQGAEKGAVEAKKLEFKVWDHRKKFAAGGTTSDDAPKIYVADLAAYNEGKLIGEWLTLTDYSDGDEVMDAIQDLLKQWSEEQGVEREEFAIHDTENIPSALRSESMGEAQFEQIIQACNKAEEMNIPVDVLLQWLSDTGADLESAEDAYQGEYDDEEDYAYRMVEDGVYNPGAYDVYVSDTDKRIVADEQADAETDYREDDELIQAADMEDELKELTNKQEAMESVESEIETLEEELGEMESDDPGYDAKESELLEKQDELKEYEGFDFDDEKEKLTDKAKEKVREDIYNKWYDGLDSDPIDFLVNDEGIYTEEDALKLDWIQKDYEHIARELGHDAHYINHDGKLYVFSSNYKKGGALGGRSKAGIAADKRIKAQHPGRRQSENGEVYYESRSNRSDENRTKRFASGGTMSLFADGGSVGENFKKELSFGKVDYDNRGRKINKVTLNVEIRNKENARDWETLQEVHNVPEVSMSASIWNGRGTDIVAGGQMVDELVHFFPGNDKIKRLVAIWEQYHLNDMKAGTRKQTEAIESWTKQGNRYDYTEAVNHLKAIGLYEDNGYKYGHGWLYQPVPESVITEIKTLCDELSAQKFAEGGSVLEDSDASVPGVHPTAFAKGGTMNAPTKIVNSDANSYAEHRLPFRGANLEGKVLDNGDYVVLSYGYYPIWWYSNTEGRWYGNSDKYSNTTARQITQSRPTYDATLLSHAELLEKMRSEDARFELGGLMVQQLSSGLQTDNTSIAHS